MVANASAMQHGICSHNQQTRILQFSFLHTPNAPTAQKARQDMSSDDQSHLRLRCRGVELLPQCILQHACSRQRFFVPWQDGNQSLCPPLVASPLNNVLSHIICIEKQFHEKKPQAYMVSRFRFTRLHAYAPKP